jgi:DNA-binding NarL/FixJ family response regulator
MQPTDRIRVFLVDDHPIVREGLRAIIDRQPDMVVTGEAGDGLQAVQLVRVQRPDVVLMDLRLPGMSGAEATEVIRRERPECRVLVLTLYDGDEDILGALRAGASGYLLKDLFRDELLSAIRCAHGGGRYLPAAVRETLAQSPPMTHLSPREMDVLRLIARGRNNKDIAASLSTTEGTVKGYVHTVLNKLGATDRTQAVMIAMQRGFVHLDW